MANQWLRLWHEMPNDPKWRTIARHSKQPISLVQATYIHLLVDASRNVTRGHADVTAEDLASALDCDEEQIQAILDAMQGRVLDGMEVSGWEKRQPKREDGADGETTAKSAAERKRAQREREKQRDSDDASRNVTAASRKVTTDKDKDKDTEKNTEPYGSVDKVDCGGDQPDGQDTPNSQSSLVDEPGGKAPAKRSLPKLPPCPKQAIVDLYHEVLPELPRVRVMDKAREKALTEIWQWSLNTPKSDGTPRATNAEEALAWLREYFVRARDNDFIMGRGYRSPDHANWRCSIEYLVSPKGLKKVIEETQPLGYTRPSTPVSTPWQDCEEERS